MHQNCIEIATIENEHLLEKISCLGDYRPGIAQTGLLSYRDWSFENVSRELNFR